MDRFWIMTARWGHMPFLAMWIPGMWGVRMSMSLTYFVVSITLVSLLILVFLKVLVHAPRPFLTQHIKAPFWVPKHDSFPSGHAWMLATGTAICFVVTGPSIVGIALSGLGMLVSYARYRAGVHRVSEVLAGYLGGAVVSVLAALALGTPFL